MRSIDKQASDPIAGFKPFRCFICLPFHSVILNPLKAARLWLELATSAPAWCEVAVYVSGISLVNQKNDEMFLDVLD